MTRRTSRRSRRRSRRDRFLNDQGQGPLSLHRSPLPLADQNPLEERRTRGSRRRKPSTSPHRLRTDKLFSKSSSYGLIQLLAEPGFAAISCRAHRVILERPKDGHLCIDHRFRARTGGSGGSDGRRTGGVFPAHGDIQLTRGKTSEEVVSKQLRCRCYSGIVVNSSPWYYHGGTPVSTIDDCTRRWFHEFLTHGTVWTGNSNNTVHRSQRLAVKPLKSSDWPRDPLGPSWPSYPSINEWMDLLRRGIDPFSRSGYENPEGNTGYTRVSRRQLSESPELATAIVANNIVGIRSSTEIPAKYWGYFRYRWNFLILTGTSALPIGLVRFLLAQWCTSPFSLWLRRAVPLKKFLRKTPISLVRRADTRRARYNALRRTVAETGSCTPSSDYSTESYSGGESDLD